MGNFSHDDRKKKYFIYKDQNELRNDQEMKKSAALQ